MKLTPKQIEAVLALSGPDRYRHFIKVAADQRRVWGLHHRDGWALAATAANEPVFPVWPAREYAERCASSEWSGYEPREIELDEFLYGLLPTLRERRTLLGVFYTPHDKGVTPSLDRLEEDLRAELARIE